MAVTLQIVSPLDQTSVLFDLNDNAGTTTADYGSVKTFLGGDVDLGSPTLATTQVESSALDTTFTTFSRRATAPTKVKLRIKATSYDNLAKAAGRLAQYLSQGCVMKWIPNGSAFTYYIDVLPSPTPALLNGQEVALFKTMGLFDTPEGMELTFTRQAYVRGAKLDPATNKLVTNPTTLRDSNQDGLGDGWTKLSTPTVTIDTPTESTKIVAAGAGAGIYQNTAAASFASGDPGTCSVDLMVTSGSVDVNLNWRTAADASISQSVTTTVGPAGWQRVTVSGTAPGTTDHIRLRLESNGGAATFFVRNAQVEKASTASPFRVVAETVKLDPAGTGMAKMMPVYNPGSAWAPLETTIAFPDASTAVQQTSYALMSSAMTPGMEYLADYLNGPYYAQAEATGNGWTVTLGSDTTTSASAGFSPGSGTASVVVAPSGTTTTPRLGVRWTRTTLLDCLRGTFAMFLRVAPSIGGSGGSVLDVSLKWGTGGAVQYSNDVYTVDNSNGASGGHRLIYLGNMTLPPGPTAPAISQLQIEAWVNCNPGHSGSLSIDYLLLMPTDDAATAAISTGPIDNVDGSTLTNPPAKLTAPASDPTWTATGSSISGTAVVFTATNNGAGWGSNTAGLFTGTGGLRHVLQASTMFTGATAGTTTWKFEVANITDNTVVASVTRSFTGTVGTEFRRPIVSFTDVAGKVYQPRIVVTSMGTNGVLTVYSVTHQAPPVIVQNQQIRTDPGSVPSRYAVEKLDSSGNLLASINGSKVPFWIPPGLSLLQVDAWEVQTDPNDLELGHLNARTLTVTPAVYPRNWV